MPFFSPRLSVTFSEETELKVVKPILEVEVGTVGDNVTLTVNSRIGCCVVTVVDEVGASVVVVVDVVVGCTVCCSVGVSSTVVGAGVSGAGASVVVVVVIVVVVVVGAAVVVVVTVVEVDETVVDVVSGFGGMVDISTQPSVCHFSGILWVM